MRNIISIIVGALISFIIPILIFYVLIYLNIGPFKQFLIAINKNMHYEQINILSKNVIIIVNFIVLPIGSFSSGLSVGLVATSKKYMIGFLSVIPIASVLLTTGIRWTYDIPGVIAIFLLTLIGVKAATYFRRVKHC